VCMDAMREGGDEAITCANGHQTCLRCAGRMVKPCANCKPACTGHRVHNSPHFIRVVTQGMEHRAERIVHWGRSRLRLMSKQSVVVNLVDLATAPGGAIPCPAGSASPPSLADLRDRGISS